MPRQIITLVHRAGKFRLFISRPCLFLFENRCHWIEGRKDYYRGGRKLLREDEEKEKETLKQIIQKKELIELCFDKVYRDTLVCQGWCFQILFGNFLENNLSHLRAMNKDNSNCLLSVLETEKRLIDKLTHTSFESSCRRRNKVIFMCFCLKHK